MVDRGVSRGLVAGLVAGAAVIGAAVVLAGHTAGPVIAALLVAAVVLGGRAAYPRVRRTIGGLRRHPGRAELRARADQQHRWALRGDPRGVYGTEGAELMRGLAPDPPIVPPGPQLPVAGVVHTAAELTEMLESKPPCWRYAAFVSVLVQRRAAVQHRLRDARMGFAAPTGESFDTDFQAAFFFTERLSDLTRIVDALDGFMLGAAFQGVFGEREDSADADGIVQAAHRLMDYHDRALALAQRCRGAQVPLTCAQLHRDVCQVTVIPLEGYQVFIETFIERVAEMADVPRYASADIELDPVTLSINDDDGLLRRVSKQLERIARRS